jgi:hypothetical protein
MNAVRVFWDKSSYERHIEHERKQRTSRLVAERLAQLEVERKARRVRRLSSVAPSSSETCRRIEAIVAREDVRQAEQHARRIAKTIKLVSGGAPGLGHRH